MTGGAPPHLVAKVGDHVWPKWIALMAFIRSTGVIRGDGVRVRVTPNGTHVWAEKDSKTWNHPFRVSISNGLATVRAGTVNKTAPTIDGVRISGVDDDGELVAVPPLEVTGTKKGRTFVGILLTLVEGELDPVDPENLKIVEKIEVDDVEDGQVFYPLSAAYWLDSRVVRTFQIVHHNLNHVWVPGQASGGRPERHIFCAA